MNLSQKQAELEKLCDEYEKQMLQLQAMFCEITSRLLSLKNMGEPGIQAALQIVPRLLETEKRFADARETSVSEKVVN